MRITNRLHISTLRALIRSERLTTFVEHASGVPEAFTDVEPCERCGALCALPGVTFDVNRSRDLETAGLRKVDHVAEVYACDDGPTDTECSECPAEPAPVPTTDCSACPDGAHGIEHVDGCALTEPTPVPYTGRKVHHERAPMTGGEVVGIGAERNADGSPVDVRVAWVNGARTAERWSELVERPASAPGTVELRRW